MTANGEVALVSTTVARFVAAPSTPAQRALAGVLDAGQGSVLSHETAASWWGLPGFAAEPIQVTRARHRKDPLSALAELHEPRRLFPHHVVRLDGVPLTTPARTVFDLANLRRIHPGRIERALDTAWARRLVGPVGLRQVLRDLQGRGRRGIPLMRGLLDARGTGYRPPESGLEARFERILRDAGISGFERQVVLGGEGEPIGRVDYVHQRALLVVEIDSDRFHTSLSDQRHDERRTAALQALGYTVLRVSEREVWHAPAALVARLRPYLPCLAPAPRPHEPAV